MAKWFSWLAPFNAYIFFRNPWPLSARMSTVSGAARPQVLSVVPPSHSPCQSSMSPSVPLFTFNSSTASVCSSTHHAAGLRLQEAPARYVAVNHLVATAQAAGPPPFRHATFASINATTAPTTPGTQAIKTIRSIRLVVCPDRPHGQQGSRPTSASASYGRFGRLKDKTLAHPSHQLTVAAGRVL